jgi:hypothetical protein
MTRISQDTAKVHLLGDDGKALCDVQYPQHTVELASWQAGFTPASLGARVCRDCEAKAGLAASFAKGERTTPRGMTPIDHA